MERLTEILNNLKRGVPQMDEKEEIKVNKNFLKSVCEYLEQLKYYKDAEEQGLLMKLPCKVGDTVWFVGNDFVNDYEVRRYIIDETGVDCIQIAKEIDGRDYWNSFSIDNFNKTVFLTKEEAEQKLKEMERDTNGKN